VKTWFQNRRMKHKKQLRKGSETNSAKISTKNGSVSSSGNGTDSEDRKDGNEITTLRPGTGNSGSFLFNKPNKRIGFKSSLSI